MFRSKAQARKLYELKPDLAKKWAAETPSIAELPERVSDRQAAVTTLLARVMGVDATGA